MSDLMTAATVGQLLGLDRSTVYRMAADGRLPAVKVGRQWRFRPAAVEELLTAGRGARDDAAAHPSPIPTDVATALTQVAATALGVMMVVVDMDGRPLTPVANPCPAFAALASDPAAVRACADEWRALADEADLRPRFVLGAFGFECARALIRSDRELVAMVLAGGTAPPDAPHVGLHVLDAEQRQRVLDALPQLAATLSRLRPAPAHVHAHHPYTPSHS